MKFTTGKVRLSYAHLFTPSAMKGSTEKKYSASLLIPKSDTKNVKRLQTAIDQIMKDDYAKQLWGNKLTGLTMPLRDGDEERPDDEAYKGMYFINAKAGEDRPPRITDRELVEVTDTREVYSGCWVQAVVTLYPYNTNGNKGVGVGLSGIRKIKDGTPLTAAVVTDADFEDDLLGSDDSDDMLG